jgi:hypothetical protein
METRARKGGTEELEYDNLAKLIKSETIPIDFLRRALALRGSTTLYGKNVDSAPAALVREAYSKVIQKGIGIYDLVYLCIHISPDTAVTDVL